MSAPCDEGQSHRSASIREKHWIGSRARADDRDDDADDDINISEEHRFKWLVYAKEYQPSDDDDDDDEVVLNSER